MKHFFTLILFLISASGVGAQYQFVSPMPGSTNLTIEHNIIIREGSLLDESSLNKNLFIIRGAKSGEHDFKMVLCCDGKTINLNPLTPFAYDENVAVSIGKGLMTSGGRIIDAYSFSFTTHREWTDEEKQRMKDLPKILLDEEISKWSNETGDSESSDTRGITGLFNIVTNSSPSPGNLFFDSWSAYYQTSDYQGISVITNGGDSVFYKSLPIGSCDLQMGQNGNFDTYRSDLNRFDVMDSNFSVIDKYYGANGYIANVHELYFLPNNNAFMLADETQIVDMTAYDPGYSPNATILGSVIQEFDAGHNLLFEWRSFDHIDILESQHLNLAANYIDYIHTNSVEVDGDGNLLVSHRHLDQITKIDVSTGDFIWRLGGVNNEFTFTNDTAGFCYQHHCRCLANGNITLYDNGNYHIPAKSYAKEYQLDEVNHTATLVWSYGHANVNGFVAYYWAMGSVQRLANGNTLIGWGWRSNTNLPSITEVTPAGTIVWEIHFISTKSIVGYRAHRYEWNSCARPTLNKMKEENITDHSAKVKWAPVANATQQYEVQYKKHTDSIWKKKIVTPDKHYLKIYGLSPNTKYDWKVQSWCDTLAGTGSHFTQTKYFITLEQKPALHEETPLVAIQLYPNPAHDVITIESSSIISQVLVMNLLGQEVKNIYFGNEDSNKSVQLSLTNLPKGNYFVEVIMGEKTVVRKVVVD